MLVKTKRSAEAEQAYRQAWKLIVPIAAKGQLNAWRYVLDDSQKHLVNLLKNAGRNEEAGQILVEYDALRKKLGPEKDAAGQQAQPSEAYKFSQELSKKGLHDEAIAVCRQILARDSNDTKARRRLGVLLNNKAWELATHRDLK